MHLILEGVGGELTELSDLRLISEALDQYPEQIGMTRIMPAYVFIYEGRGPEERGISGFVLLAESHISIHTFPQLGTIIVDLFSLKEFDSDVAVQFLMNTFVLGSVESRLVEGGIEYTPTMSIQDLHDSILSERG